MASRPRGKLTHAKVMATCAAFIALGWVLLAPSAPASSTAPPKIVISSPKNGETVNTPTVIVKGKFTVAPFDGPSPPIVAMLNGKKLNTSVNGAVSYDFQGDASLKKGANTLTVTVNDGNGGESSSSVTVKYVKILPTRRQCVSDKRGDSHDHFTHMDIVNACAQRRGARVIFSVTTAHSPPNIHDGFGNPAAPCIEIPRPSGPASIQTCGDAMLRGWKMHYWPKVPFEISGRVSKWKVPLKYLPKKSFEWCAYVSDADHYRDKAPNKGYLTFVVK
jgi:hypothetical protein